MATTSLTALRRFAGFVFTLLFTSACLCAVAAGQLPQVTSSVVNGLAAPPTYGAIWQTAVSSHGDFLIADFQNAAVYQYPAGGGAPITIFASGKSGPGGGWANLGMALDQYDNLYLDNNWNGGMQRIPYNAATGTWNVSADGVSNPISAISGYFQGAGLASNKNNQFVMSSECCSPSILSWNLDASGNATNVQTVISTATSRAKALAMDNAGNIFIWEDGGIPNVLEVPAGTVGLADDKSLTAVDPTTIDPTSGKVIQLLQNISGMAVDAAGNLYVGDGSAGVYMVPNQGGMLNPANWVMITPVPATGQISIDQQRDILYVPTKSLWNGYVDLVSVSLGNAELGSSPVGTQSGTPVTVYYSFSGLATAPFTGAITPARFVIQEDGVNTPDFAIVNGGSCVTGTTYPIPGTASANPVYTCTVQVAVNPQKAGSVSAQLLMQTASQMNHQTVYTTVSSTTLHGTGLAGEIQTTPAWESAVGSSLMTPAQVATDAMGNVYVADAGLKQVLMYAAGSGMSATPVSVGTGLAAPTGVAVDGAGDVFIADSGNVFEVPNGPGGLSSANQTTGMSGLGANLKLAADGLGHLYVADPAEGQVVELYNLGGTSGFFGQSAVMLTSGLTAPSYVAVDASNNLYIVDGTNLFEMSNGMMSTLVSNLSNATGVAVDPSGAVYVSSSGGTVRIPYVSGALVPANQAAIASTVTNPQGVAIDNMGNVYLADATALNLHLVSASGTLDFGNVALGDQPSLDATITNDGNAPLTVTGYASTNALDYTGADGTCMASSPIAPGGTCAVNVTLAPGPGEQGTLTGQIQIQSTAANAPIVVNATGVGAPLATSLVSTITVASTAEVINTPVTVTVTQGSGTTVPTGQVSITFTTITGATSTVWAPLVDGSASFTLAPVAAGNATFTVNYAGDRVYGRSTAKTTAAVAKSAIAAITLPITPPTFLPYVLEGFIGGGQPPYDGSPQYWEYNYQVTVTAAAGQPTGTVTFMDSYQAGVSTTLTNGVACPTQNGAAVQTIAPNGTATFATNCLPMPQNLTYTPVVSTHVITPVYSGDANFLTYTGTPTTFIAIRSPLVQLCPQGAVCTSTSPAPSLSVSAGSSASITLTLSSIDGYGWAGQGGLLNNYQFPVALACSNLPPHATCSFTYQPDSNLTAFGLSATTPNAVNIPCTGAQGSNGALDGCNNPADPALPVIVTINTNVAAGTTTSQIVRSTPVALAALFGFGMIGLFFRRKAAQKAGIVLMLGLAVLGGALAVSMTACSTTNLSPASVLTTPSGSYPVTVTAEQVGTQCIVVQGSSSSNCTTASGQAGTGVFGSQVQVSLPFVINVTVQ